MNFNDKMNELWLMVIVIIGIIIFFYMFISFVPKNPIINGPLNLIHQKADTYEILRWDP